MRIGAACFVLGLAIMAAARAADPPPGSGLAASWLLERVVLADGRPVAGLIIDETTDGDVGLIEVVRRPGRPMHLVSRRLPAPMVASIERLPDEDRAVLAARIETFRSNGKAEREAAASLRLARNDEDGPWRYEGAAFTLESSAGQVFTRQAIVRLESLLDAFEGVVAPSAAADPARSLTVRLCGSQPEYARAQAEAGVRVANPAFYVPRRGLLVAGSDVPAVLEQARLAADGLDSTVERQRRLDAEVTAGLRGLAAELEAQGIPGGQRSGIIDRTRARWQREREKTLARVDEARKENDARVARARGEFFTALAHEAWHAYADLRLGDGGLPAWLDEGLAQVFETGLLEAGELRLDAPDPRRLTQVAALLERDPGPLLPPLIAGGERLFVVGHGNAAATSRQAYLLAWAVAYDLALGAPTLSARSIEAIARGDSPDVDPVARFERLTGMPLAEFEASWRARMLNLTRRPTPAPAVPGEQAAARPLPASAAGTPAVPDR